MATKQRQCVCLKAGEKYRLMRWVDERRQACVDHTDAQLAIMAGADLELKITESHIGNVRREFGIVKAPPMIASVGFSARIKHESRRISELAAIIADLCGRTGNELLAREARNLVEEEA